MKYCTIIFILIINFINWSDAILKSTEVIFQLDKKLALLREKLNDGIHENDIEQVKNVIEITKFKIKPSVLINSITHNSRFNNYTPLFLAVRMGNLDIIKLLIDNGGDVNFENLFNHTPLYYAVMHDNNMNVTKLLLENGAKTNLHFDQYEGSIEYLDTTLLHVAVRNQDLNLVKLLIQYNANANAYELNHFTPVRYAILDYLDAEYPYSNYLFDIVKELFKQRIHLTTFNNGVEINCWTSLHHAVRRRDMKLVYLMTNNGVNVNTRECVDNKTALHFSAQFGGREIIKMLLNADAKINVLDRFNNTTLHLSAQYCLPGTTTYLLCNNADHNVKNVNGQTALDLANAIILPNQYCKETEKNELISILNGSFQYNCTVINATVQKNIDDAVKNKFFYKYIKSNASTYFSYLFLTSFIMLLLN